MSKALASCARMAALAATLFALGTGVAHAQSPRPNILVIWGDDIGVHNVSAFTDAYGQQSCTAGRASFILGHR